MKKTQGQVRRVDMDHRVLIVFVSLWSSEFWAEDVHSSTVLPGDVRLVGGASRCAGRLEMKVQGESKSVDNEPPVDDQYDEWNLTLAAEVCRRLNCGSVVSLRRQLSSFFTWQQDGFFRFDTLQLLTEDLSSKFEITCSDSVRLVNGTNLCSGRLEVKSNQSWSSVCEDDFDLQDAEVVCRELDCGAPSVFKGGLYGDVEAPVWTKEFQCGGNESALLDCDSSDRNTCSSDKAVGLTCSEPAGVRLVGGGSRCDGKLEMKHQDEWKPVSEDNWNLRLAGVVCAELDCGSAVSTRRTWEPKAQESWAINSNCDASSLMECSPELRYSFVTPEITCSDSVRLVNGTNLCSGRLEVKSNQSWSSVCEDDFDLQDAEVVCRELDCGAPSVFKGGLYGDVEAPVWTKEFQCGGNESALLDCDSSDRNTCSSDKAVGLTCSDPDDVRLVGGANSCTGRLELKHQGDWKAVDNPDSNWNLNVTAVICQWLDCGSPLSTGKKTNSSEQPVWWIYSTCVQSKSALKECVTTKDASSSSILGITCSDSVRLVNRTNLCSGRLEVKSNQSWSSVCEDDFDLQDAEVVCRELGCGAPSVFKGGLYGDVEAPVWTKEFQCGGNESALLDCDSSDRNTCSSDKAVGLTCSDPDYIRLVGEASRCAGTLEMKNQGEWRPVADWDSDWDQKSAAAACRLMDCGSAVATNITEDFLDRLVWWIKSSCVQSASALLECVLTPRVDETYTGLNVICSDLLFQPNISPSPLTVGVYKAKQQGLQVLMGSDFTITCSIEPQYPGGSFQLVFTTSAKSQNYTLPAVNHSAHFLFSAADPAHRGEYRCVYHLKVYSHNFSSESRPLYLTVSASLTELIIRLVVLLLGVLLLITAICCSSKASRSQKPGREKNTEVMDRVLGGAKRKKSNLQIARFTRR